MIAIPLSGVPPRGKKEVELIQGTLRDGMNITPNEPFLAPMAPEGRLKNAKKQNWAKH